MTENSGVPSFDGGVQPGDRWGQETWDRTRRDVEEMQDRTRREHDYTQRHRMQAIARILKEERAEMAVKTGELGDPLVRLLCETRNHKGDECGRWAGSIYPFESTYVLLAKLYPSKRRLAAIERWARSTDAAVESTAETIAWASHRQELTCLLDDWPDFILEPGKATWTAIACPSHGDGQAELSWLRDLAQAAKVDPARRKVKVDVRALPGTLSL